MAYYTYKRVRELMPEHLEAKFKAEWEEQRKDPDHKKYEIQRLIDLSNSPERAEELYSQREWFWDNDYDGDLFEAAAEYIIELKAELAAIKAQKPVAEVTGQYYAGLYDEMPIGLKLYTNIIAKE